jgi:signal transduction histidine kinase
METNRTETSARREALVDHDNTIQSLFGIALRLSYCRDVIDESPEQVKVALDDILHYMDGVIDGLRKRIYELDSRRAG